MAKRIGLWPFYSQQDKATEKFRLDTCGATKQALYIESRLHALGVACRTVVPLNCDSPFSDSVYTPLPLNNGEQTVCWDPWTIKQVFADCDAAVLWHEFLAIPVRKIFPRLPIAQILAVAPNGPLFPVAWSCADRVVTQTFTAAYHVRNTLEVPVDVWPMCYRDEDIVRDLRPRDIDVLFVDRCSSSNYTRHVEFSKLYWSGLNVFYTDVTGYLRRTNPEFNYTTDYYSDLARTKIVVSLKDDMFGGQAIREAVASGCIPVVLENSAYRELVGPFWPFTVKKDLSDLEEKVRFALAVGSGVDRTHLDRSIAIQSYDASWVAIERTLRCMTSL